MKKVLLMFITAIMCMPLMLNAQFTATFGTGTSATTTGGSAGAPMSYGGAYSWCQQIYRAAELTAANVPPGAVILSISFYNATGATTMSDIRTYMGHRTSDYFSGTSDWAPYNTLTLVDSGDWVAPAGWFDVNLDAPFVWDGTSNIVVGVSFRGAHSDYSTNNPNCGYQYTTQSGNAHIRRFSTTLSSCDPTSTAAANSVSSSRPNLKITYIVSGCASLTPTVANIGPYSADLNWFNFQQTVSSWDLLYGEAGTFDTLSGGNTVTGVTDTFYNLTGLTAGTMYQVYMKPYCSSEVGTWSAPRTFTTLAACPTPVNLTLMSHTAEEATITWLPGATETGWEVACVPHGSPVYSVTPDYASSYPYTITNLIDNTHYDVYVRADCGTGEYSYWTSAISFTTDPYCTEATNVHATQVQGTSALVVWNSAPVGATGYTVGYSEAGQDNWTTVPSVTGTSYMLTGLTPNTAYDVFVLSECDMGDADSVFATFTTNCLVGGDLPIGDGTSTSSYIPSYSTYENGYTQQIFTAAEMGGAAQINSISFDMTALSQQRHFKIYLMHTTSSDLSSGWLPASNATLVYDAPHTFVTGWNTFNFSTPFSYDGTSNLLLVVIDSNDSWSSGNTWRTHSAFTGSARYTYQDNTQYSISTVPSAAGTALSTRNNVIFGVPCDSTATCVSPNVYVDEFDANSISVAWAPGYTESSWELEYSTDGTNWTSEGVVTTSPYTISNLTENTMYIVRMRSICGGGDYSDYSAASVRTACADMTTLPYIENFDSYTGATTTSVSSNNLPYCWSYLNEGTSTSYSGYPIIYASATYAASGSNSIRFYTYTTAGTYDDQIAILPPIDTDVNPMSTLQVAFDVRALSTTYPFHLDVGIMTDPTDRNTFVTMQTITTQTTTYANYEIPFNQYTGTGKYIALRASMPTTGYNYGYVDNVRVELIPACPKPTNVTSTVVTTNSVTLGWSEVGTATSWVITYGPTGFTPGSSVAMTETVYDNPYTITGLSASMGYDFYVQSDCGGGELSNMSNVYTVATQCDLITSLPLMENFDSYAGSTTTSVSVNNLPYCWSNHNTGTSTSYSGYPMIYASATYAASGNNAMRFYIYTTSGTYSDQIAILPEIDVNTFPINTLQLSFDARRMSSSYNFNLVVGVMTDPTVASSFTPVQTISVPSITYENFEVPFASYTGTGAFIAIKAPQPTSNYNEGYIDNIVLDVAPLCSKPTNVTATNITADGADINWMPGGNETDWEVVVVPAGMSVTAGTAEPTSVHPYTLSNLSPITSYDVYVRADCGTGTDFSSWSQACHFTTTPLCSAPTNVTVSQVAGTSALLTWTEAIFGATGYTVSYTETGMNNWITQSVTGDNYMLTGLTPETAYTVTITSECDEGVAPTVTKTFTTPCLFGGNLHIGEGTATTSYFPEYSLYEYSYSQQIFLSSEVGGAAEISSVAFECTTVADPTRNLQVYLMHTTSTTSSSWLSAASAQQVYSGNVTFVSGWNTLNFTTPFQYNGTDNLALIVVDVTGTWTSTNYFRSHTTTQSLGRYAYQDGTPYSVTSIPSDGTTTTTRNNVIFGLPCDNTVTCVAPNVYVSDATDNSITLNWAPGNNESSWEIETSTDNVTWNLEGTTTSAPYTLNNLNANTLYYIRMRSVCGGGEFSNWTVVSHRTDCAPIATLPYLENFDSYAGATTTSVAVSNLPYCWSNINEGTSTSYSGYPIIYASATYASSGSNSMRFYTYTTAGTYDDQVAVLPPIDVNTHPMNTLQLSFDARALSTSYPFVLEVGILTDPTDINTFMLISSITTQVTTYANYEIPLSQYTGTGAYIAIRASQPTSNYNYGYVDNVMVDLIPACPKPTNVHATNVTTTSIDLAWTEVGTATSWVIEYGPAGFTPGNGTTENAYSNPYTLSNLSASTTYDFYVRSDCGGGDFSALSNVYTTTTACDAISTLPFSENFDAYGTGTTVYVPCWGKINTYTSADRPYVNSTHYAGVGSLYFYAASATYNIAITPPFDQTIPVSTLQATFMYRASSSTDYMIVGVMTNPTDASTFVPVDTIYPASSATTWVEREVLFNGYTGTGQYIAFYNGKPSTTCYSYIDNLVIDLIPTCPKPTQVHVVSASTSSIELGWTENGPATEWEIEYGPAGFTQGNGTVESATTNPYTINNLTSSTQYDFYVRAVCGAGDTSYYAPVFTTSTECDAITQLPYTEGFDTYGTGDPAYPLCWGKINTYSANRPYVNSTHYAGVGSLYFYAASATYNIAIVPQFDASIPVNTLQATFMYRASSTTDYMIVGVMTNASDASSFVPVDTVYPASTASTWVEKEVVFSGYTGSGHYIAFYNGKPSTTCYSYIDDLSIDLIPACPKPQNVHVVNATVNSIELGWTEVGSATSWEIAYGAPGFDPNGTTATTVTANTNPFTISNLAGSTPYEFYVRALCGGTDVSYWSQGTQASTTMAPENLPYTADFSANDAWVLNNGSCTNYWVKGTVSGTPALFVTDNGTTPNYTITSTSVVAAQKLFTIGTADSLTITFDVQVQGEGSFDYMKLFLAPASQQYPASTSAPGSSDYGYNSYSTYAYDFYTNGYGTQSSYHYVLNMVTGTAHVVAKMPNPNASPNANSTALMVFAWKNDASVGTQPPATITNLSVTAGSGTVTTNPTVATAAATGISTTGATLHGTITNPDNVTITAKGFEWKATTGGTYTQIAGTGTGNGFTANLTNLTPNTSYTYKAFITYNGQTAYGSEMTFTTLQQGADPCNVPTGLHVTSYAIETITVAWDAAANVNSWNIQYRPVGGTLSSGTSTTNSYTITDLTGNTDYEIQVQANCGDGNVSDWSPKITVHTSDVGIENWLENSIVLYPNPAKEYVDIRVDGDLNVTAMEVYDVYGKLINTVNVIDNPTRINVSSLANGMYFVRVTTEAGVVTKTFVKK